MFSFQQAVDEIKRVSGESDVRFIPDRVNKAVWFLRNYTGEMEISKNALCKYFHTSPDTLRRRTWSILLGYSDQQHTETRYLAPMYEQALAEKIDNANVKWDSLVKDEVLAEV